MRRPFLPILPYLERYPFLKIGSKLFKFSKDEVLSNVEKARDFVEKVLEDKVEFDFKPIDFLCSNCGIREECEGYEGCSYNISSAEYHLKLSRAKKAVLNWLRCKVVVSNLDEFLRRRFAVKLARLYRDLILKECDDFILFMADDFGLNHEGFSIHVADYLKYAVRMKSDDWKLVNRFLSKGYVDLSRNEFVRLMEEVIKEILMEKVQINLNVRLKGDFKRKELERLPLKVECFPECMKSILSDLNEGKNVPHTGRFAIASFLINIGYDVENVVDVFRNAPDFDEDKTRYQVEHIAGLRGKGERYVAPSCETMKSWGLCVWSCEVDHPIKFYRRCLSGGDKGKRSSKRKGDSQDYA